MAQSLVLGMLTGALAVGFHVSLDFGEALRVQLLELARDNGEYGPLLILSMVLVATLFSAGALLALAPEASGSGIPHLKAVLLGRARFRWWRVIILKFFSTVVGVTGGLVLGRGGPSVHMGGAVGQAVANFWPGKGRDDCSVLVAAGGGAGLAAAFNAPLAGLVFVLEELEWRFASLEFFTAAIACLASDTVCRALLGQYPLFDLAYAHTPPLSLLVAFLPLGIVSALLGGLFNRLLLVGQGLIMLSWTGRLVWWLLLATVVTGVAWVHPQLLGSGQILVDSFLRGEGLALPAALAFFFLRFVLTIASSSSGAAGGIFIPVLVLGATLGWVLGMSGQMLFPASGIDPKLFAVVGMAAYFTGVVHAPLTGIVLIIEMTGNYTLILPLFVACFSALLVSDWLGILPIYEALLENDLRKDRFKQSEQSRV